MHATLLLQVLEGDRLVNTPYQIKFRADVDNAELCKKKLNSKELQQFRDAVKNDYYFQASHGACSAKGGSMEAVAAFRSILLPAVQPANAHPSLLCLSRAAMQLLLFNHGVGSLPTRRCTMTTCQFGVSLARLRRWSALASTSGYSALSSTLGMHVAASCQGTGSCCILQVVGFLLQPAVACLQSPSLPPSLCRQLNIPAHFYHCFRYFLFTHFHFELSYNENNVIEINVSSDPMRTIEITNGDSLEVSTC
jgi:hypothetical protein